MFEDRIASGLTVALTVRRGEAGARRRQCSVPETLEHARAPDVPGVRNDEQLLRLVKRTKRAPFRHLIRHVRPRCLREAVTCHARLALAKRRASPRFVWPLTGHRLRSLLRVVKLDRGC